MMCFFLAHHKSCYSIPSETLCSGSSGSACCPGARPPSGPVWVQSTDQHRQRVWSSAWEIRLPASRHQEEGKHQKHHAAGEPTPSSVLRVRHKKLLLLYPLPSFYSLSMGIHLIVGLNMSTRCWKFYLSFRSNRQNHYIDMCMKKEHKLLHSGGKQSNSYFVLSWV